MAATSKYFKNVMLNRRMNNKGKKTEDELLFFGGLVTCFGLVPTPKAVTVRK